MKRYVYIMMLATAVGLTACSLGKSTDAEVISLAEDASTDVEGDVSDDSTDEDIEIGEGVYDEYVFININGEIKRYRRLSSDLGQTNLDCVTDERLLLKWGAGDEWRFYEMIEYPCRERILGLGPGGGIFELAPYRGVDISEIEAVRNSDAILLLNGSVESGKEIWEDFCGKASKHMPASVIIADCYTQSENVSAGLKIAEAGDYPCLFFSKLTYDGIEFVIEPIYRENGEYEVKEDEYYDIHTSYYKYLRHFEGEAEFPGMIYSYYDIYILTDNDTDDWKDIESSHWLNPMGAIPYEQVYGEYEWKDNAPFAPLQ